MLKPMWVAVKERKLSYKKMGMFGGERGFRNHLFIDSVLAFFAWGGGGGRGSYSKEYSL